MERSVLLLRCMLPNSTLICSYIRVSSTTISAHFESISLTESEVGQLALDGFPSVIEELRTILQIIQIQNFEQNISIF